MAIKKMIKVPDRDPFIGADLNANFVDIDDNFEYLEEEIYESNSSVHLTREEIDACVLDGFATESGKEIQLWKHRNGTTFLTGTIIKKDGIALQHNDLIMKLPSGWEPIEFTAERSSLMFSYSPSDPFKSFVIHILTDGRVIFNTSGQSAGGSTKVFLTMFWRSAPIGG